MKGKISVTRDPRYGENGYWAGYDVPFQPLGEPNIAIGCWMVRTVVRAGRDQRGMIVGMCDLARNPLQGRRMAEAWLKKYAKRKVGHRWAMEHCRRFAFRFDG